MTLLKYVTTSGVCTTAELLNLKRNDPAGYDILLKFAAEEMAHNNIAIEEAKK